VKKIILIITFAVMIVAINSAEAKSSCPENTEWDGNNCISTETGAPIIFTDYAGNPVVKSKESQETIIEDIIITAPKHEILRDLMIIEPEIIDIDDKRGVALEQKVKLDRSDQTNITRNNYYFDKIIQWTTKNAEAQFQKIVLGKHVQNSDFGKNDKPQIEYTKRYERYEDPVLQYNLIKENYRAQKIVLINWGNFTDN
jgi:hypothetical protein